MTIKENKIIAGQQPPQRGAGIEKNRTLVLSHSVIAFPYNTPISL